MFITGLICKSKSKITSRRTAKHYHCLKQTNTSLFQILQPLESKGHHTPRQALRSQSSGTRDRGIGLLEESRHLLTITRSLKNFQWRSGAGMKIQDHGCTMNLSKHKLVIGSPCRRLGMWLPAKFAVCSTTPSSPKWTLPWKIQLVNAQHGSG